MKSPTQMRTLLCCLLLFSHSTVGRGSSWGHNAVGIRLSPRQRSVRLLADSSSHLYPAILPSFSRRHERPISNDNRSFDTVDAESSMSSVDFCSTETTKEPTIGMCNHRKHANRLAAGTPTGSTRGGATGTAGMRPLVFWENMVCGAISRSIAQTVMHPANTMKTILQSYRGTDARPTITSLAAPSNFRALTRGAGANFLLSVPHGAVNFAVLELVRGRMNRIVESNPTLSKNADRIGAGLDFLSSAISTICCSVVSTPQMMITDNIMAGNYPNLPAAVKGLASTQGLAGFYTGWWPGLAGKIPSYALTWTLFQQLKAAQTRVFDRPPKDIENSIMGCIASATTVCIMIPMDTIKTRLVTQASLAATGADIVPYKGIIDCATRIAREEGVRVFYRGLPPRLVSVVPMIGIQFGVYEFMKKVMVNRGNPRNPTLKGKQKKEASLRESYGREQAFEEAFMEVAADDDQPFPAPHFSDRYKNLKERLSPKPKKAKT